MEPIATGNLAKTPFAHVLLYIRERQLTGTLAVQLGDAAGDLAGESLLGFELGALTQVRLPAVLDPLGFVLRELGVITDVQLNDSLVRLARAEGLQGEILVAMGACDSQAIERALVEQIKRKAVRLFAPSNAPYQYFEQDLLVGYGGARVSVDVLGVLWRGVRAHPDARAIEGILTRVGANAIRLRPGAGDPRVMDFDRAERGVLDVLRAEPATVDRLSSAGGDPRVVRALVYTLVISKQVEVAPAGGFAPATPSVATPPGGIDRRSRPPARDPSLPPPPPSPSPRLSSPPPPTVPAAHQARFAEAQARLAAMDGETYYEMLGVATSASTETVREAFLARAAEWHPDRVPSHVPALRDVYQEIFAHLNEAQATLSDDKTRAAYFATVQEGGGTPNSQRKIGDLIEAATDVQKAEICLKRREYDDAERLCRHAMIVAPDDPTTLTVLACALIERGNPAAADEAEALLVKAVQIAPKGDRARVVLGTVYKRRGDNARALEQFRAAASANPRNVDAMREVRLAEMRTRAGTTGTQPAVQSSASTETPTGEEKKPAGLFSRFLKR